jgi:hypothetical protein
MNRDRDTIVRAFLKSMLDFRLREPEPGHRIDMRLQLADIVLDELPGNDIEELAHRGHAAAVRNFYLTPDDPDRHETFERAMRAYIDTLESLQPQSEND